MARSLGGTCSAVGVLLAVGAHGCGSPSGGARVASRALPSASGSDADPAPSTAIARDATPSTARDRCVPVARCQMFPALAGHGCALVGADGTIHLPDPVARLATLGADLERRCPGDPGGQELSACLEFVEAQFRCKYRPPLRSPPYRCWLADGRCHEIAP